MLLRPKIVGKSRKQLNSVKNARTFKSHGRSLFPTDMSYMNFQTTDAKIQQEGHSNDDVFRQ